MNRRVALGIAVVALAIAAQPLAWAAQNAGWVTLVDGKSMNPGWDRTGDADWRVMDGALQAGKGGGFLVTKNSYGDFEIRAEFWVDDDANSGIFLRCEDPKMPSAMTCYEVNIFDKRPEQDYATGAIVNVAKVNPVPKTGGRWNTYEIVAKGPQLTVTLNGVKTAEVRDTKHARGPIALQYAAGTVKFRKLEIRPL